MKTILVVDDNADNRYLLECILISDGYHVIAASNGYEAISKNLSEQPDLILIDIQMPDINGNEAARLIRHSMESDRIPIIVAISSYELTGDMTDVLTAEYAAYFEKPINPEHILMNIRNLLSE